MYLYMSLMKELIHEFMNLKNNTLQLIIDQNLTGKFTTNSIEQKDVFLNSSNISIIFPVSILNKIHQFGNELVLEFIF